MSVEALRALARAHGIAAVVATAALVAAAWAALRRPARRWIEIAAGAGAALLISIAFALGVLLDDAYRSRIRQQLFVSAPGLGWLFERKEHLAFGAILLAWSALCALGAARLLPRDRGAIAIAGDLDRAAKVGWTAAALLAIVACIASVIVARRVGF